MLTDKYAAAVGQLYTVGSGVDVREEGGKLYLKGMTEYQMQANEVWDQLKTVPDWQNEVVADIQAQRTDVFGVYTVKAGDTLSKIAKLHLGDANKYMAIFEANRDQLTDPNMIRAGQELKLPAK
jgi:nucleoid-associated protein YgaU